MMRLRSLVPLAGIVAVALFVVGAVVAGETPDSDAPLGEITSFYIDNETDQEIGAGLFAYGALAFVFFASALVNRLRRWELERIGASTLSLIGATLLAVGLLVFSGILFVVGASPSTLEPGALQALHVLNNEFFAPLGVGVFAFLLGSGIAIVRSRALPAWLGWVAIVGALPALSPAFFVSLIVLGAWLIVVSFLLTLSDPDPPGPATPLSP